MITITVHANKDENLYSLLINKEYELRQNKRGSFIRRSGTVRTKKDIWVHKKYPGWIMFNKGVNGSISCTAQSKNDGEEWQIFASYISFLQRDFKNQIASITITF
jgi:hypothetical protein